MNLPRCCSLDQCHCNRLCLGAGTWPGGLTSPGWPHSSAFYTDPTTIYLDICLANRGLMGQQGDHICLLQNFKVQRAPRSRITAHEEVWARRGQSTVLTGLVGLWYTMWAQIPICPTLTDRGPWSQWVSGSVNVCSHHVPGVWTWASFLTLYASVSSSVKGS